MNHRIGLKDSLLLVGHLTSIDCVPSRNPEEIVELMIDGKRGDVVK